MLEDKKNQMKREIETFFRALDKFYLASLSHPKILNPNTVTPEMKPENKFLAKKLKKLSQKNDTNYFMKLVEKYKELAAKRPTIITLQKTSKEDNLFSILDVIAPRNLTQDKKRLQANDDIWKMIPYKHFTPEQKYEKYKKIMDKVITYNNLIVIC